MKAILEFNLPEDEGYYKIASTAESWALTVWDLDNYLRNKIKFEDKDYQEVRDFLYEVLDDRNINFNMLET